MEDDINKTVGPPALSRVSLTPRPLQREGAKAILRAAHAGARSFLLADDPGVGKTLTARIAVKVIAATRPVKNVVVIVDRPTSITTPHWRNQIAAAGDDGLRWLLISPDQLRKLLARNGKPKWQFDVCIVDEAQNFRHLSAQRTTFMHRIVRYDQPHHRAPFAIYLTATPGNSVTELTYLSPLFAQLHGEPVARWKDLGTRMQEAGLPLVKLRGKWGWDSRTEASSRLQQRAIAHVRGWMANSTPPTMLHRAAPWGDAPLGGLPVELDQARRRAYDAEWGEFQHEMGLARRGSNIARGRAALLRFRQKAGLLRVTDTAEWIIGQVNADRQVAVSVEFIDTAANPLRERLSDAGLTVACIYGSGLFDPETERLRFQTGKASVCLFTVTASISLHASELLPTGKRASTTPRVGMFHQPRYSGIAGRQVLGRTHRDNQVCPWHVSYAEDTIEEQVARIMLDRLRTSNDVVGGGSTALHTLAKLLGADWLPEEALTAV